MSEPPQHPYDRHVGRYGSELARGLIAVADIRPPQRVLDVGCGTGQLTRELAALVGAESVAAIDPAEGVVSVCAARVPGADVRVGSAEALPFPDAAFDAALAQLVINLVADPPGAVTEMARVVSDGGAVAACFWDDERMPLLRSFWDAVGAVAPEALAGVGEQAQVGLAGLRVLREWWGAAGLRDVELGDFEVGAEYDDFADLFFSFEAGVGHSGTVYTSLAEAEQEAVRADAYRRLGSPEGPFRLTAQVRTVRGVR